MSQKTYKLKDEYKGLSISLNIFGVGMVTLDTNTVSELDYDKYHKLGFTQIIDVIEESVCIHQQKCEGECKTTKEINLVKEYKGIENPVKETIKKTNGRKPKNK